MDFTNLPPPEYAGPGLQITRPAKKSRKKPLFFGGVLLVLLGSMPAGYLLYKSQHRTSPAPVAAPSATVNQTSPTPKPVPIDQTAVAKAADNKLSQSINTAVNKWIATNPNQDWAVLVRGLDNYVEVSINHNKTFQTGSIYKLFLLAVLSQKVDYSKWSAIALSGTNGRNLLQCVKDMIRISDNDCAIAVGVYLNWNYVQTQVQSYGFTHIHFDRPVYTEGTAGDAASLMEQFYDGKFLTSTERSLLFDAMKHQLYRDGIPSGCNNCSAIYNKTGDSGLVHNDIAIITVHGKNYILTIFSSGSTWPQVAMLSSKITGFL